MFSEVTGGDFLDGFAATGVAQFAAAFARLVDDENGTHMQEKLSSTEDGFVIAAGFSGQADAAISGGGSAQFFYNYTGNDTFSLSSHRLGFMETANLGISTSVD